MCAETLFVIVHRQVMTCPNASFTDLAEIVSRIEPVKPALVDGKSMLNLINLPFKSTFGRPELLGIHLQNIDPSSAAF